MVTSSNVLAHLPIECIDESGEILQGWIKLSYAFNENGDALEGVQKDILWPKLPIVSKLPEFSIESMPLDYQTKLQQMINVKNKGYLNNRMMKQQFISLMATAFQPYLLDFDDEDHEYISLYIHLSTGNEVLGAAVVNGLNSLDSS